MSSEKAKKDPSVTVGVLVYDDAGNILIGRQPKWDDAWTCFGGHLELGETVEQAVKREIKEESGLDIEDVEFVQFQESVYDPHFHEKRHFVFLDFAAKKIGGHVTLNEEYTEHKWVTPEKALMIGLNDSTRSFIEEFIKKRGSITHKN
ncbi:NUDIX domain-containing protein [Candidatus Woesearchaeota archaeon]|nr:NUDIX domain-containing protein [Candidatus Woesearchaeota archaeon]